MVKDEYKNKNLDSFVRDNPCFDIFCECDSTYKTYNSKVDLENKGKIICKNLDLWKYEEEEE